MMTRRSTLDGPLLRLETLERDGTVITSGLLVLTAALLTGSYHAVTLVDAGQLPWGTAGWMTGEAVATLLSVAILALFATALALLAILAHAEPAQWVALHLRALPALRRARPAQLSAAGLLALAGALTPADLAVSAAARRYHDNLGELLGGTDASAVATALRSRADRCGLPASRLDALRDFLDHDGTVLDLVPLALLSVEERRHLAMVERQIRVLLYERTGRPFSSRLVHELLLPSLTVAAERRSSLTTLLLRNAPNDPRADTLAERVIRLARELNALDATQFEAYLRLRPGWTGDDEALLHAARTT
jgi:hypothetical protein